MKRMKFCHGEKRNYIDNHFYPAKENIIDVRKEKFVQTLNISEVLAELEIVEDHFSRVLSISEDHDLELYLKIQSKS